MLKKALKLKYRVHREKLRANLNVEEIFKVTILHHVDRFQSPILFLFELWIIRLIAITFSSTWLRTYGNEQVRLEHGNHQPSFVDTDTGDIVFSCLSLIGPFFIGVSLTSLIIFRYQSISYTRLLLHCGLSCRGSRVESAAVPPGSPVSVRLGALMVFPHPNPNARAAIRCSLIFYTIPAR